jgi:hypothetical protein
MRNAEIRVAVHGEERPAPGAGAAGPVIEGEFRRLGERGTDPAGGHGSKP